MSIKHLRVDNRLIHGQVTTNWIGSVGADQVIVCNDAAAHNTLQKQMLSLAARGVKTDVLTTEETISVLSKDTGKKIFVITANVKDAFEIVNHGLIPEEFNVGNQAKPINATDGDFVTKSVYVTNDDAELYMKIADKGIKISCQMLPSTSKYNMVDLIKKNRKLNRQ